MPACVWRGLYRHLHDDPCAISLADVFSLARLARGAHPEWVVRLVAAACSAFTVLRHAIPARRLEVLRVAARLIGERTPTPRDGLPGGRSAGLDGSLSAAMGTTALLLKSFRSGASHVPPTCDSPAALVRVAPRFRSPLPLRGGDLLCGVRSLEVVHTMTGTEPPCGWPLAWLVSARDGSARAPRSTPAPRRPSARMPRRIWCPCSDTL